MGFKELFGDPDDVFAYATARTVNIRDRRLGLTYLFLQTCVLVYVVGIQIIYFQGYKLVDTTSALSRVTLRQPAAAYRSPRAAPFCAGGQPVAGYGVNAPAGTYTYLGAGGLTSPQLPCAYLDEGYTLSPPMELDAAFITTSIRATNVRGSSFGQLA